MQLIADSGSTKTDWVLFNNNKPEKRFHTPGINPYFKSSKQISEELLPVFEKECKSTSIEEVNFYGAGCSSPEKNKVVEDAIKNIYPSTKIFVNHDMLAAARALLGNKTGIACILGTGSNSCLYDGEKITENLFSLGYMFGDEGSGAHIGKTYIKKHLKKQTPIELKEAFEKKYAISDEDILTNIYQKPNPNKYLASFTYFLKENLEHPFVKNIIEFCFDEFIHEQVSKYTNYKSHPVSFVGSIAYNFKGILTDTLKKREITSGEIFQSPMENLIKYHRGWKD